MRADDPAAQLAAYWSERVERWGSRDGLFALRLGLGVHRRRLESMAPDTRDRCLARIRDRVARVPFEALVHRPEIIFAIGEKGHDP